MRWSDISQTLGVSERTVRRRRHQFGMSVEGREFSNMSDYQLDEFVGRILQATPAVGLRVIMGSLRHHGHTVQRHHVLHSITSMLRNSQRVIRRSCNVACPNASLPWLLLSLEERHLLLCSTLIVVSTESFLRDWSELEK